MNIIRARFMHQHKDNAVYERQIVLDTPSLSQYDGKTTTYLEFDMPLLLGIEPEFVKRWVMSGQNCRVTKDKRESPRLQSWIAGINYFHYLCNKDTTKDDSIQI